MNTQSNHTSKTKYESLVNDNYTNFGIIESTPTGDLILPKKVLEHSGIESYNGLEIIIFDISLPLKNTPTEELEYNIFGKENLSETDFHPMKNKIQQLTRTNSGDFTIKAPLKGTIRKEYKRIITTNGYGGYIMYSPIEKGDIISNIWRNPNAKILFK